VNAIRRIPTTAISMSVIMSLPSCRQLASARHVLKARNASFAVVRSATSVEESLRVTSVVSVHSASLVESLDSIRAAAERNAKSKL
jgi:hypothetical protein